LKAGANDFLLKDKLARLVPAIERELRQAGNRRSHRQAEMRYQLLVEQLPIVVYVNPVDEMSSTTYVSPQIQTILGYLPEEWLSDPEFWQRRIHPDDREAVLASVELAGTRWTRRLVSGSNSACSRPHRDTPVLAGAQIRYYQAQAGRR
jgi:PAS domain-containing protein